MNQDVDEQLNDVSLAIQTTVGEVETDFNAKIQEVESMVGDLNSKIDQLHLDIDNQLNVVNASVEAAVADVETSVNSKVN